MLQTSLPQTAVNDAGTGTVAWTNPGNATLCDTVYADAATGLVSATITDTLANLVIGGVRSGYNMGTGFIAWPGGTPLVVNYGASNSLPGVTLTPSDVNASNFGFILCAEGGGVFIQFLKVTNFGFSIPLDARIIGVTIAVTKYQTSSPVTARVDCVQMTVYYVVFNTITGASSIVNISSLSVQ